MPPLRHWQVLAADGAFLPDGRFVALPPALDSLHASNPRFSVTPIADLPHARVGPPYPTDRSGLGPGKQSAAASELAAGSAGDHTLAASRMIDLSLYRTIVSATNAFVAAPGPIQVRTIHRCRTDNPMVAVAA